MPAGGAEAQQKDAGLAYIRLGGDLCYKRRDILALLAAPLNHLTAGDELLELPLPIKKMKLRY